MTVKPASFLIFEVEAIQRLNFKALCTWFIFFSGHDSFF